MAGNLFSKVIGLAAIGLASHDTVSSTNLLAPKYAQKVRIEQLNDVYMKNSMLSTPSVGDSTLQKWSKRWALDNDIFKGSRKLRCYMKCGFKKFLDNAVMFGLGAVALLTGKGKFSVLKIPYLNKIAAATLAYLWGSTVVKNIFGIGQDYRSLLNDK